MARFVLIPGAWLGAWAWKDVAKALETKGHSAYPVTLTGMGERAHLVRPEHGMETAVEDVRGVVKFNELQDYVVVGHSFAGKVAAAVADREHAHVSKVIYVDAFRPERVREPQGGFDPSREFGAPPQGTHAIPLTEATVDQIGKDVVGPHRERLMRLATPWPIKLAKDPITLSANYSRVKEAYVFCTLSGDPVDEIVAGKWGKLEGPHKLIETGHWPMLTKPSELAGQLIELAT